MIVSNLRVQNAFFFLTIQVFLRGKQGAQSIFLLEGKNETQPHSNLLRIIFQLLGQGQHNFQKCQSLALLRQS